MCLKNTELTFWTSTCGMQRPTVEVLNAMVSGLLNTQRLHAPAPVLPGGPGSAFCPPSPLEDTYFSDLPDQPVKALGLSAPIRAYHSGPLTPHNPACSLIAPGA